MTFLEPLEEDAERELRHERRIKRCGSCNGMVIWFETAAGRRMPVDALTVEAEDDELDLTRHVSHFATCPNAAQHRKPR